MLPITLSILLMATFAFLGGLHVYWAFGGRKWIKGAIPEVKGKPALQPGPLATMVVAAGLFMMGILALLIVLQEIQVWTWLGWGVAAIFLIRALGDFKYVGFFKRRGQQSIFARRDTQFYSPLCLGISLSFVCLILI